MRCSFCHSRRTGIEGADFNPIKPDTRSATAQRQSWGATVSFTCLNAVVVPTLNPGQVGERLPFPQIDQTRSACCPGFSFRQPDPIEAR
jgi:hypothetical protein